MWLFVAFFCLVSPVCLYFSIYHDLFSTQWSTQTCKEQTLDHAWDICAQAQSYQSEETPFKSPSGAGADAASGLKYSDIETDNNSHSHSNCAGDLKWSINCMCLDFGNQSIRGNSCKHGLNMHTPHRIVKIKYIPLACAKHLKIKPEKLRTNDYDVQGCIYPLYLWIVLIWHGSLYHYFAATAFVTQAGNIVNQACLHGSNPVVTVYSPHPANFLSNIHHLQQS